jgi:tetratricopeptide (TPR) repeat protein
MKRFLQNNYFRFSIAAIILLAAAVLFFPPVHKLFHKSDDAPVIAPPDKSHFTIYILGGSTAYGEPYAPLADFGKIISYYFNGSLNGRPIDVVNLGVPCGDAAYALKIAKKLAAMKFATGSAVVLLYLGNNEFLKYDDNHNLEKDERILFDQPTITNNQRKEILHKYEILVSDIIKTIRNAGLPVIASTSVVNLKDWSPNRSVLSDSENRQDMEKLLNEGDALLRRGLHQEALVKYQMMMKLEPSFALAHKRVGDCYMLAGKPDIAESFFQNAVTYDGNPYRETAQQNRYLLNLGKRFGFPVVDAASVLSEATGDHVVGYEMMLDNCHPNLYGYALIADKMAAVIETLFRAKRAIPGVDIGSIQKHFAIDESILCRVYINRGKYCYASATLTFDPSDRLERADYYFSEAYKINPLDIDLVCSLAVYEGIRKKPAKSLALWKQAYSINPAVTLARARDIRVVQIMKRAGVKNLASLLDNRSR